MDRQDDIKAGIKSTAVLFGDSVHHAVSIFGFVFVLCLIWAGIRNGQGAPYFVVSCGGMAVHIFTQLMTWNANDVNDSGSKFEVRGLNLHAQPSLTINVDKREYGCYYNGRLIFRFMTVNTDAERIAVIFVRRDCSNKVHRSP